MDELVHRLNSIDDSYYDFVCAISAYARKKASRLEAVLSFLKQNPTASSSEVVRFVSEQDDFYEDAACEDIKYGA
ncbi:MAG: hypothetical protein E7297_01745 [Lachnospiraceae bacterium]|jgi:hypothetical protein|nr:hypothetical protein [Lachnospiraceae bacterium]